MLAEGKLEVRKQECRADFLDSSVPDLQRQLDSNRLEIYCNNQCAHCASQHIHILNRRCCVVVHSLCIRSQNFSLSTSAEKLASCNTLGLVLLSRIRFPEAVRSFRCVKFVNSSVESSIPSRWRASLFWLYWSIEKHTHTAVHMHSWLIAKILRMMIVCLSRTLDVNGLPYLDSRSLFENASDAIKYFIKLLSCPRRRDPVLRLVCSSTCDTMFFLVQVNTNTTDLTWIAFSVSSFAIAKLVYPMFIVVRHRHEHASSFEITRFSGSQECWISLMILVTVAWAFAPMELHWSARDIILEHSCRWVSRALSPMLGPPWRCYFSITIQSLRIHVRLFSTPVLLGLQ